MNYLLIIGMHSVYLQRHGPDAAGRASQLQDWEVL